MTDHDSTRGRTTQPGGKLLRDSLETRPVRDPIEIKSPTLMPGEREFSSALTPGSGGKLRSANENK